jgi:hypothetical protein
MGRLLQSPFFNVFHEDVGNDWGKWRTLSHTDGLLVELAVEAEKGKG